MRLRQWARAAKARAIRFQKADTPIIVFALRRGGSTMVSDAVSLNPGVWFANEPFAVLPPHPGYALKQRILPPREHTQFFALTPPEQEKVTRYMEGLLAAEYRELGSCQNTKPLLRADRVCLKILNTPWMVSHFTETTDAQIVTVLRHPAAQALSVIHQKWGFAVEAYYHARPRIEDMLSQAQWDCMDAVLGGGDIWKIAVLDYAVTSKHMREDHKDTLVRYEDIVRAPEDFVDGVLIDRLRLEDRTGMIASFQSPSGSSRMSQSNTKAAIRSGDKDVVLKRWMDKVDPEMAATGQEILDIFEVENYTMFDPY
ncbi:MAG: sulfotransferase domain-containing protein [Roseobacter sp.]|jgi:hypothetical protein|nr:sulfotransferase domain-containing protein [Roseobacter sp.]